ncbi:COR domain-containing protein [Pontibacter sp. G13]|uniref:COR domain-containing protein n=1 Tax=Pontibacter sp. G13 TaxID=3074898 RepID=UPI00288BCE98|nr:COR domain-containing protein [Pontibacter sp. G13]WNJ18737.1 COR domain-containing protein [Pontibacter sp. G13]
MQLPELLNSIQACVDTPLNAQLDIRHFYETAYPDSYRVGMDLTWEMSRSYHAGHVFVEDGKVIGLNLCGLAFSQEQLDQLVQLPLEDLWTLNLSYTQIRRMHVPASWKSLEVLILFENPTLEQLLFMGPTPELWRLEAANCGLETAELPKGENGVHEKLHYVDLEGNKKLKELELECEYPDLHTLMLRECALASFSLRYETKTLAHLYLSFNKISKLELGPELRWDTLSSLLLRENELGGLPEDLLERMPHLDALYLGTNPLPMDVRSKIEAYGPDRNHLKIYQKYLDQRKIGRLHPDDECKVLFIGNGKAGKTNLVRKIMGLPFDPDWKSTHGITLEVKNLKPPKGVGVPYRLNLWDFGGQDIYHSTHRLFMKANAVYVLAWCQETEYQETCTGEEIGRDGAKITVSYQNHSLTYWLNYAQKLGEKNPLILTKTRSTPDQYASSDRDQVSKTIASFAGAFPNGPAHLAVESSEPHAKLSGYEPFHQSLWDAVKEVKSRGTDTIAEPLYRLRNYLRELQKSGEKRLNLSQYEKKAKELKVIDPLLELETWLHETGVVHYRKGMFDDEIVLDQVWAIEAIYSLLRRDDGLAAHIRDNQGFFSGKMALELWRRKIKGFQEEDAKTFINYMMSCDLCFEMTHADQSEGFEHRNFMAPQHFSGERPNSFELPFEGGDYGEYVCQAGFVPPGVIQALICRSIEYRDPEAKRAYYRDGILLRKGTGRQAQVLALECLPDSGRITILFKPRAIPLLKQIRTEVLSLLEGDGFQETIQFNDDRSMPWNDWESSQAGMADPLKMVEPEPFDPSLGQSRTISANQDEQVDLMGKQVSERKTLFTSPADRDEAKIIKSMMEKLSEESQKELKFLKEKRHKLSMDRIKTANPMLEFELDEEISKINEQIKAILTASGDDNKAKSSKPFQKGEKKILFMSANPRNRTHLEVKKELRFLQSEYMRGGNDHSYVFLEAEFGVDAQRFQRALDAKPSILHFSGHGINEGLYIQDDNGNAIPYRISGLKRSFKHHTESLKAIILNACFSKDIALTLSDLGFLVIGTSGRIHDSTSIEFSKGFYSALGSGKDFQICFEEGLTAAEMTQAFQPDLIHAYQNGARLPWT